MNNDERKSIGILTGMLRYATEYDGVQYHLIGIKDGLAARYDGVHDTERGVMKARKLHDSIWPSRTPDKWIMVVVSDVPDGDIAINEEAAEACRKLVDGERDDA